MIFIIKKSNSGFSLIEVLIALVLGALAFGLVVSRPFSDRPELERSIEDIKSAVRFSTDEALLRNTSVRIHFFLDKNPQEYAVEYGPSENFILPPKEEAQVVTSLAEEEKRKQLGQQINRKFNKVQEFQNKNKQLPNDARIIGIGSAVSEQFHTDGEISLYFYPNGEKDGAIIIWGTSEELAQLEVDAFSENLEEEFLIIEKENTNEELIDIQLKMAMEAYGKWVKK